MGGRGLPKASTYGARPHGVEPFGAECVLSIVAAMAVMSPGASGFFVDLSVFKQSFTQSFKRFKQSFELFSRALLNSQHHTGAHLESFLKTFK